MIMASRMFRVGRVVQHGLARPLGSLSFAAGPAFLSASAKAIPRAVPLWFMASRRALSTTKPVQKFDPATIKPHQLSPDEYHRLADDYLNGICLRFEELQDKGNDIDVEFSNGVMTLIFPFGSYVINKQPPNNQIWLSSPKSGPSRYDWVIVNEGQDVKEGTGHGDWVNTRDGTSINEIFATEANIDLTTPI